MIDYILFFMPSTPKHSRPQIHNFLFCSQHFLFRSLLPIPFTSLATLLLKGPRKFLRSLHKKHNSTGNTSTQFVVAFALIQNIRFLEMRRTCVGTFFGLHHKIDGRKLKKNIQIKIEIMIALEQMDERQTFHDVVNQIQPQKQQEKNPKHI